MSKILCFGVCVLFACFQTQAEGSALVGHPSIHRVDNSSSCAGRCGQPLDPQAPCQCNTACIRYNDCCENYDFLCGGSGSLEQIAEELLALDENNVANLVVVNPDSRPLLTLHPFVYLQPTISLLIKLHDNFIPDVRVTEDVTPVEAAEQENFLNAVFETPVMRRAQEYLTGLGFNATREYLTHIWFGIFNRGTGTASSSGFEHVFLGEIMNGGISGFHNWVYFAAEEANGNATNGVTAKLLNFDKGWVIEHSMNWLGSYKPIGGGFIGTSPEFEMAIYSICYVVRPDALCPISLNGRKLNIQTYVTQPSHSTTSKYISTAYTALPPASSA